jgi:hypothetical protein
VMMLSASSNLVPVKLEIEKQQRDGSLLWLLNVRPPPSHRWRACCRRLCRSWVKRPLLRGAASQ